MSKAMAVDSGTGRFPGTFQASVEGDYLRFDFDESPRKGMREGDLDDARMQERLISLVASDTTERAYHPLPTGGGAVASFREDQYPLAGDPKGDLLDLAWETGPLFGVYDSDLGLVEGGTVREPIECWRAAAGTLGFAARLRDAASDARMWRLLNHEVVFTEVVYPASNVRKAKFMNDLGFPGPYRHVVEVGEKEYHRALPPLVEGPDSQAVLYRGGYQVDDVAVEHPIVPLAYFLSQGAPFPAIPQEWAVAARRAAEEMADPPALSALSGIYVVRVEGPNPQAEGRDDEDPYRFGRLPDGELSVATLSNSDGRVPSDVRECLYRELYNTVVRLHTRRCSEELLLQKTSSPFYCCALERIWCAFGREAILNRIRSCRTCGRPFFVGGGIRKKTYCSDKCRERYKNGSRREMREKVKSCIRAMGPGSRFSKKFFDKYTPEYGRELEGAVRELRAEGWRIRSLGGRSPRYELVGPPVV